MGLKMEEENNTHRPYLVGFGVYSIAVILGSGVSFALAAYWLELSSVWVAILLGGVFSVFGVFLGENVGEAIIFSFILGILVSVFILSGPKIPILRAVILPVAMGLSVGKLVVGISKEVSG